MIYIVILLHGQTTESIRSESTIIVGDQLSYSTSISSYYKSSDLLLETEVLQRIHMQSNHKNITKRRVVAGNRELSLFRSTSFSRNHKFFLGRGSILYEMHRK